ncbi:MAG: TlpA disulfide reductase family protein [Gammaproteobacteria bacterium]|nr:TlpA disulfide reductase family protein [Gammaproteobacteria bacterium]
MARTFWIALMGCDAETPTMVLTGDVSIRYSNGDFLLYYRHRPRTDGGRESESFEAEVEVAGKAPIGSDGKFRLEVEVDRPQPVYFVVLNAFDEERKRLASATMGNRFILEPGNLRMTMGAGHRFVIRGGKYNDLVYNTWRLSDDYRSAVDEMENLAEPAGNENEEARRRDRRSEVQDEMSRLEAEGRSSIARTHPDLLARRLVIESAQSIGPWTLEALRSLAELTPDDPWAADFLAELEAAIEVAKRGKRFTVGSGIRDFAGATLEGQTVRLADVRATSRYVLVEFWASWCGPCIVEIPHMKEAYARYRDRGFEIVSFTIDEDREAWEDASAKAQLPWHDLGMGPQAEAPTEFGVVGVPKNYLVDSKSGKIVATDLRPHHLDEKLRELLD